jgi:hypothetical protein
MHGTHTPPPTDSQVARCQLAGRNPAELRGSIASPLVVLGARPPSPTGATFETHQRSNPPKPDIDFIEVFGAENCDLRSVPPLDLLGGSRRFAGARTADRRQRAGAAIDAELGVGAATAVISSGGVRCFRIPQRSR